MGERRSSELIESIARIHEEATHCRAGERCLVAPAPELSKLIKKELEQLRGNASPAVARLLQARDQNRVGFNDGLIFPGSYFPMGTSAAVVRSVAGARAPMQGTLRVIVVLVDFSDEGFSAAHSNQYYHDLFFSDGVLPKGSVREFYHEVSDGKVELTGEVVGPYRMPKTLKQYAHGASGTGGVEPDARTLAKDAAVAANVKVDFAPYDNDHDGFVDAYVIVQAGPGAESTGSNDQIWSHKWVLPSAYSADGTKIYAYLVVPEEARVGVCAHELGHLLFGFPDLYDTDYSSEGIGNWCLMAGGSWNGGGDVPAHPSAWCKANQHWVNVVQPTTNGTHSIADVKDSKTVYHLWKDGGAGDEYFLVENRQKKGFDSALPGQGLLIWHVDEAIASNADETHPKVALMQADGAKDLENGSNRGDAGDPYPGSSNNNAFNSTSTPNSKSYGGMDTCVAVQAIGPSGPVMTAELRVKCAAITKLLPEKPLKKEFWKERAKEHLKELVKEGKEWKEKEHKELKEWKELKEKDKELAEWPGGFGFGVGGPAGGASAAELPPEAYGAPARAGADPEARIAALEQQMAAILPFIHAALRPDLGRSALAHEEDVEAKRGEAQARSRAAKKTRRRKK